MNGIKLIFIPFFCSSFYALIFRMTHDGIVYEALSNIVKIERVSIFGVL